MQSSRWATPAAAPPPPPEPFTHSEGPVDDMTYQSMSDPLEDQFAQTRGADDLFDDDFTPIAQPAQEEQQIDAQDHQTTQPSTATAIISADSQGPGVSSSRHAAPKIVGRGSRGRGRGRGRGGPEGALARSTDAPIIDTVKPATGAGAITENPVTDPSVEKKDMAVRGDRTATGGNKREKLTDEQLAQKLETMRLKNAKLTADHERSLQDAAAFTKREAVAAEQAAQKRKEERQNRQVMMGERERNRLRKLNALGGREWDIEKGEGQFEKDAEEREGHRGGRARRGAHGAIVGPPTTEPSSKLEDRSERPSESATARQGFDSRGRGRGRGRGSRGGHEGNDRRPQRDKQSVPSAADFPDLPSSQPTDQGKEVGPAPQLSFPADKKTNFKSAIESTTAIPNAESKTSTARLQTEATKQIDKDKFGFSPITPGTEKKSWADQVEGT